MKFSNRIEKIGYSPIRKFHSHVVKATESGKKIYYLNIGQPDILTPPTFFDAIANFHERVLEYMPSQGIPGLLASMKRYYEKIHVILDESDIIVTNGGSEALVLAINCICDPGDEIIAAEPFYANYSSFILSAGAKITPVTTKAETGYHYPSKKSIEEKITDKTKAIIVTNPGNPTGMVLSPEEINWIKEVAIENDLFVITDEVYREFVYDGQEMFSFGRIEEIEDRVVIIDSISKRFSACGARIGALISKNQELIAHAMKIAQGRLSAPTMEQVGAEALYQVDSSYFDDIKAEYEKRRDTCYEGMSQIEGVVCEKPAGAFYITAKLPIEDSEDFLIFMLRDFDDRGETVMFSPLDGFYATSGLGKNEIRIAYVLKEADLKRAIEILKKGIEEYRNRGQ